MGMFKASIQRSNSNKVRKEDYLIGKKMQVWDNSYLRNVETGCCVDLYEQIVTIISMPYIKVVKTPICSVTYKVEMVKVIGPNNQKYEVLFNEKWIIKD